MKLCTRLSTRKDVATRILKVLLIGATWVSCLAGSAPAADLRTASPASSWALVVNGDDSFTHKRNADIAIRSLLAVGYDKSRILLVSDVASPERSVKRVEATKTGFRQALERLSRAMRPGDTVLVYLTGHGAKRLGQSLIQLRSGFLSASKLVGMLEELPYGKLILVADQCYSGGFVEAARKATRKVVAVASTDDRHKTRCEPFARPFWYAVSDPRSDLNNDGMISIEEAFDVARTAARMGFDRLPPHVRKGLRIAPSYFSSTATDGGQTSFL